MVSTLHLLVALSTSLAAADDKHAWSLPEGDDRRIPSFQHAAQLSSPPSRQWCYPSGLRVYAESTATDGLVVLATVVGAGSGAETDDQHGVAHLVEHLWFRSARPEGHQVRTELAALGVWKNAYTYRDRTVFLTSSTDAHLADLLALEADRLTDPLRGVTEAGFAVEREVVRNELRRGYEFLGRSGTDALFAQLFPAGHPYRHPTIGTHDSLSRLELDTARDFVAAHYKPDNASVHIRGDVHLNPLQEQVTEALPLALRAAPGGDDGAPRRCSALDTEPPPDPPPPHDTALVEVPYPGTERVARLGWLLPGGFSRAGAMSDAMLELLERSIEETTGEPASCVQWSMHDASVAFCDVEVPGRGNGQALLRKMELATDRMFNGYGWSWVGAWVGARNRLASRLLDDQDDRFNASSSAPLEQAAFAHWTGDNAYYSKTYTWVGTPAIGDAEAWWSQWFGRDRAARLLLVPAEDAPAEPVLQAPEAVAAPPAPAADPLDAGALSARMRLPAREGVVAARFDNGLTVLAAESGTAGLAEVRLVLPGGRLSEPSPGANALASLFLQSLDGDLFSKRFWQAPRFVSGRWTSSHSAQDLTLGVTGASSELESLLYLTRRRAEQARVEGKLGPFRKALLEEYGEVERLASVQAERLRMDRQVGDHPGRDPWRLDHLERWRETAEKAAQAWLDQVLQPAGATLIVVSRQDPEAAIARARTWFSDWEPKALEQRPERPWIALPPPPERSLHLVPSPASNQRIVELTCVLDRERDTPSEAARLATRWLDDQLLYGVRVERGAAYSPGARLQTLPGGGVLLHAQARVQPGAAGDALQVILSSLEDAATGGISADALALYARVEADHTARWYRSVGSMVAVLHAQALDPEHLDRVWSRATALAAVAPAQASDALRPCVGHETITVVGPEGTAEELAAAGFAPTR